VPDLSTNLELRYPIKLFQCTISQVLSQELKNKTKIKPRIE
jgi:hypothetical protein